MAVSTSTKFSLGRVITVPQVVNAFDKFEEHTSCKYPLGFKVEDGEGNIYRYSHFGAACDRGVVVAQDVSESSLAESDNIIVASASAQTVTDGLIGSKFVEITMTGGAQTANQYRGGKFITTDDAGEGYTYDIVSNTAIDDPTTGSVRIELKQKLQSAVTAATDFIIIGSKYANLEIATSNTDNILAGVTTCQKTINCYGWIQTKGICGILQSGTVAIGDNQILSSTSGAVMTPDTVTACRVNQIVGVSIVDGDTTGHGAVLIDLE
jgi:hypothetical protein